MKKCFLGNVTAKALNNASNLLYRKDNNKKRIEEKQNTYKI